MIRNDFLRQHVIPTAVSVFFDMYKLFRCSVIERHSQRDARIPFSGFRGRKHFFFFSIHHRYFMLYNERFIISAIDFFIRFKFRVFGKRRIYILFFGNQIFQHPYGKQCPLSCICRFRKFFFRRYIVFVRIYSDIFKIYARRPIEHGLCTALGNTEPLKFRIHGIARIDFLHIRVFGGFQFADRFRIGDGCRFDIALQGRRFFIIFCNPRSYAVGIGQQKQFRIQIKFFRRFVFVFKRLRQHGV